MNSKYSQLNKKLFMDTTEILSTEIKNEDAEMYTYF